MKSLREDVFLIGPFIGEFSWEYYRFAPYIIYLKKEHPTKKIIVFTRETRFDLYGIYADILLPLKLSNDTNQLGFKIKNFKKDHYILLSKTFNKQYSDKYRIIDHIYPDISMFYYKLNWQFSRLLMDYDFKPRIRNKKITDKHLSSHNVLLDLDDDVIETTDNIKKVSELKLCYKKLLDVNCSMIGCLIESIKKCKYVIGNLNSDVSKLSLLLKTPLVTVNESLTDDEIHLINPYNTPVIRSSNIEEGVAIYENNF